MRILEALTEAESDGFSVKRDKRDGRRLFCYKNRIKIVLEIVSGNVVHIKTNRPLAATSFMEILLRHNTDLFIFCNQTLVKTGEDYEDQFNQLSLSDFELNFNNQYYNDEQFRLYRKGNFVDYIRLGEKSIVLRNSLTGVFEAQKELRTLNDVKHFIESIEELHDLVIRAKAEVRKVLSSWGASTKTFDIFDIYDDRYLVLISVVAGNGNPSIQTYVCRLTKDSLGKAPTVNEDTIRLFEQGATLTEVINEVKEKIMDFALPRT